MVFLVYREDKKTGRLYGPFAVRSIRRSGCKTPRQFVASEVTTASWKNPEMQAKMEAGIKRYFDKKMKRRLIELVKEGA